MSLLDFLFPPPPNLPPLPDSEPDWAAGDRAECINDGGWLNIATGIEEAGPAYRQVLRVTSVCQIQGHLFLYLDGWEPYRYSAGHFRKIRPASDADWLKKARAKPRDLVPA